MNSLILEQRCEAKHVYLRINTNTRRPTTDKWIADDHLNYTNYMYNKSNLKTR